MILPRTIRATINKLAHQHGLTAERRMRAELTERARRLVEGGADYDEIVDFLCAQAPAREREAAE